MEWWQTLISVITALLVMVITKLTDNWTNNKKEKREFIRKQLIKNIEQLEEIFNTISTYYELSSTYYPIEYKREKLQKFYDDIEFDLLGKCHKYSELVQPVRDMIHLIKIFCSIDNKDNLMPQNREELHNKFKEIKKIYEELKNNYNK